MNETSNFVLAIIRKEHNLDPAADILEFIRNLVNEVDFYKSQRDKLYRRAIAAEQIIENTRLILGISDKKELSILEAIQALKRRAS